MVPPAPVIRTLLPLKSASTFVISRIFCGLPSTSSTSIGFMGKLLPSVTIFPNSVRSGTRETGTPISSAAEVTCLTASPFIFEFVITILCGPIPLLHRSLKTLDISSIFPRIGTPRIFLPIRPPSSSIIPTTLYGI